MPQQEEKPPPLIEREATISNGQLRSVAFRIARGFAPDGRLAHFVVDKHAAPECTPPLASFQPLSGGQSDSRFATYHRGNFNRVVWGDNREKLEAVRHGQSWRIRYVGEGTDSSTIFMALMAEVLDLNPAVSFLIRLREIAECIVRAVAEARREAEVRWYKLFTSAATAEEGLRCLPGIVQDKLRNFPPPLLSEAHAALKTA